MIRDVTLLLLALGALSAGFARDFKAVSAFIIVALFTYYVSERSHKHSVKVEKELNIVATKLLHTVLLSIIGIALLAVLTDVRPDYTLLLLAAAIAACAPNSLSTAFYKRLVRKAEHVNYRSFQKIGRTALSTSAASLFLVLVGGLGLGLLHVLPAITPIQILLLDVIVLSIPLVIVHKETRDTKKFEAAHIERGTVVDRQALKNFISFGLLAALLTYASYLFFFVRINLAPGFLDPTLPQYHQATTVALVTLALCSWSYLLFERAHTHHKFFTEHLTSNKQLIKSFVIALVALILVIYLPFLQSYFGTEAMTAADWSAAIFVAGLYSLGRLLQRYTRLHSRQHVLKLHQ